MFKRRGFGPAYCGQWGSQQEKVCGCSCQLLAICTSTALTQNFHGTSTTLKNGLVLLSASVERVSVSRMRIYFYTFSKSFCQEDFCQASLRSRPLFMTCSSGMVIASLRPAVNWCAGMVAGITRNGHKTLHTGVRDGREQNKKKYFCEFRYVITLITTKISP